MKPDMFKGIDLLVVGSPTQQFRATDAMRVYLNSLPKDVVKGIWAATFDTRLTQAFIDKHPPLSFVGRMFGYAAERIAKVDAEKVCVYTDTVTRGNVMFYEHFGFQCVEECSVERTGVIVWALRRPVQ
jgi:hypothetical protein